MIFIVDGAQSMSHFDINIKSLNCNGYLILSHKLYTLQEQEYV